MSYDFSKKKYNLFLKIASLTLAILFAMLGFFDIQSNKKVFADSSDTTNSYSYNFNIDNLNIYLYLLNYKFTMADSDLTFETCSEYVSTIDTSDFLQNLNFKTSYTYDGVETTYTPLITNLKYTISGFTFDESMTSNVNSIISEHDNLDYGLPRVLYCAHIDNLSFSVDLPVSFNNFYLSVDLNSNTNLIKFMKNNSYVSFVPYIFADTYNCNFYRVNDLYYFAHLEQSTDIVNFMNHHRFYLPDNNSLQFQLYDLTSYSDFSMPWVSPIVESKNINVYDYFTDDILLSIPYNTLENAKCNQFFLKDIKKIIPLKLGYSISKILHTGFGLSESKDDDIVGYSISYYVMCLANTDYFYNMGVNSVDTDSYYNNGYKVGYNNGYKVGYNKGFSSGTATAENTKTTLSSLIFSIFDAPFNVIKNAFNFDIFGINVGSILLAIISLLLVGFLISKFI